MFDRSALTVVLHRVLWPPCLRYRSGPPPEAFAGGRRWDVLGALTSLASLAGTGGSRGSAAAAKVTDR